MFHADASLVITPYYVKPPQRALVQHFTHIADSVPLPMIVYNCPGRTGVDMKPETVAQFSKHPMIVGIKDATGDLSRVATIRELCGPDFAIFRYGVFLFLTPIPSLYLLFVQHLSYAATNPIQSIIF